MSRITLIALGPIAAGEELLVTYVNPEAGVRQRRRELLEWGFGECRCQRCLDEAKGLVKGGQEENQAVGLGADGDLERELKASLGVL